MLAWCVKPQEQTVRLSTNTLHFSNGASCWVWLHPMVRPWLSMLYVGCEHHYENEDKSVYLIDGGIAWWVKGMLSVNQYWIGSLIPSSSWDIVSWTWGCEKSATHFSASEEYIKNKVERINTNKLCISINMFRNILKEWRRPFWLSSKELLFLKLWTMTGQPSESDLQISTTRSNGCLYEEMSRKSI